MRLYRALGEVLIGAGLLDVVEKLSAVQRWREQRAIDGLRRRHLVLDVGREGCTNSTSIFSELERDLAMPTLEPGRIGQDVHESTNKPIPNGKDEIVVVSNPVSTRSERQIVSATMRFE